MADSETRKIVCSNLVRLLREAREQRGFSMTVLAQKSGLSLAMISFVERELRIPTIDTLLRIADALDIELGAVIQKASREAQRQKHKATK